MPVFGRRDQVELLGVTGPGPAVERDLAGRLDIEGDRDLALGDRVLFQFDVLEDRVREDRSRIHGVDEEYDGQGDQQAEGAEVAPAFQILLLGDLELGDLAREREGWCLGRNGRRAGAGSGRDDFGGAGGFWLVEVEADADAG